MTYELLTTGRGVMTDRTPVLQDVRDTYAVSFVLPESGVYIALLKGADGVEYRKTVTGGVCKLPKELLKVEQYAELTVCRVDGERIVATWECEPLKISSLINARRSQWQLSGGMTDKDAYARMAELERNNAALETTVEGYKADLNEQAEKIQAEQKRLSEAVASVKRER